MTKNLMPLALYITGVVCLWPLPLRYFIGAVALAGASLWYTNFMVEHIEKKGERLTVVDEVTPKKENDDLPT